MHSYIQYSKFFGQLPATCRQFDGNLPATCRQAQMLPAYCRQIAGNLPAFCRNSTKNRPIEELKKYRDPPAIIKKICGFLARLLNLERHDWEFCREQLLSRANLQKDLEGIDRNKLTDRYDTNGIVKSNWGCFYKNLL